MKIKVRAVIPDCKFEFIKKGDWIDLKAADDVKILGPISETLHSKTFEGKTFKTRDVEFDSNLIPLGIAMQLPKGFEAHILPRSSSFKKFGITMANSMGIVDETYCGNEDEWKFNAIAYRNTIIHRGDRICQFRIELSQKATIWQKIKWLFTRKIKFVWVNKLENKNRGGFGSTGIN